MKITRRQFITTTIGTAAGLGARGLFAAGDDGDTMVPRRRFGRHEDQVSVVGIGGHTLYFTESQQVANRITHHAIDYGINFFDNAWDYHGGESEEIMGKALEGKRDQVFLMTKLCNYHRQKYTPDKAGAMKMLEDSLRRLKTDHLDLWMLHSVQDKDPKQASSPGGALEAMEEARQQGKIRYTGFTGHTSPDAHRKLIELDFAWDAMLMPVSVLGALRSRQFEKLVMPLCEEKNMAVLGMKGFGGSHQKYLNKKTTATEVLRYALSYPQLCTQLVGIDRLDYLKQAIAASTSVPMTAEERNRFLEM